MKKLYRILFILSLTSGVSYAQLKMDSVLLGTKKFGVQFIEGYGKATISKKDKGYFIKGEQYTKDKQEYCILEGSLTPKDANTLIFSGQLKLFTKDCCGEIVSDKTFTFLCTGKRKFWRLQERSAICDEYAKCCYYLDIFKN
jgi:hypothetical protein